MKNYKKQLYKIYFDDNYFNKSINPLFFETARPLVHKNVYGKRVWHALRGNNAFYRHKQLEAGATVGKGWLKCPD